MLEGDLAAISSVMPKGVEHTGDQTNGYYYFSVMRFHLMPKGVK